MSIVNTDTAEVVEHKDMEKRPKYRLTGRQFAMLILLPSLFIVLSFTVFPLLYSLSVSFSYYSLIDLGRTAFIGLDNYRRAFNDPFFWSGITKTATMTIGAISLQLVFGTAIAFLLNRKFRFQGFTRMILLLPLASAPLAVGLIWRMMYHPDFGIIPWFVSQLGFQAPNFLGSSSTAMLSIIIFDVWQWTPFVAFIVLAGLQSLPKEPFEAAAIDGASPLKVFRTLTLPMLSQFLLVAFLLRVIDLVRAYDQIFALTMGGPGTATETLAWYLYRVGFKYLDMGFASSISIVFLYVVVVLSVVAIKTIMRARDTY